MLNTHFVLHFLCWNYFFGGMPQVTIDDVANRVSLSKRQHENSINRSFLV